MNSQEQQRRRTAVDQLAADTETVIDGLIASTGQRLEELQVQIVQALEDLDKRVPYDRPLDAYRCRGCALLQAEIGNDLDALRLDLTESLATLRTDLRRVDVAWTLETEPLRRGFWGRMKHLWVGR